MLPVPTEFSYPTHYFSYEIFIGEEEKWHPPMLGRDNLFYEHVGAFGRFMAYNVQYWLASRTNPLQSFFSSYFFEKFFFFQDYGFTYLWLYFPWVTMLFNYPIGTFQIQFEFYFPYFFFFCSFVAVVFYIFSSFFYINRAFNDFFLSSIIISYFFISLPLFFYFSFPVFLFGMLILFFVNVFTFPFILYFSEYVSANFGYIYSPKSHQLYLPLPPSETSFVSISSLPEKNKKYSNKNFQFFERNNQSFPGKKAEFKRFTIFPFFNNNLQSLKVHMARKVYSDTFYSYSSARFKKGVNDIRQFIPHEGPAIYDIKIPDYDTERINLFAMYEEMDDLLETEIELEYGPDFEHSNDPFIPPENEDEWEQLSSQHFHTYKFKYSRISYFNNSSSDIDFDLRPVMSDWIHNEIGRTWALKHWLRILNPSYTDRPTSFSLMYKSTIYADPKLSIFFDRLLYASSYYFKIIELFFNFFFPPFILRRFSSEITNEDFISSLSEISKFGRAVFFSSSNYTNLLRTLFSLETFFLNNCKSISFKDKLFYFSTLSELLFFFNNISKRRYFVGDTFILKVVISQLSRMLGRKK